MEQSWLLSSVLLVMQLNKMFLSVASQGDILVTKEKPLRGLAQTVLFLINVLGDSATVCSSFSQVVTRRTLVPRDLGMAREQVPLFMPSEGAKNTFQLC